MLFVRVLLGGSQGIISKFRFHRSSRPEVFCKIGIFSKFTKFKGKHLCQRPARSLRPATLFKKETLAQVFSCEFCGNF